ncbi:hypothetical protein ACU6VI_04740 [Sphaerotilus natans]|uniref:hypothetical protein n=1 Tax=Sphaerotilus natans TaxID=34103 RepID=UPI00406C26B7
MTTTITALRASALALAAAAVLAGCGGGGSDAGCVSFSGSCTTSTDSSSGSGSTSGSTTAAAASIAVTMSADTISASTPGTVTAVAKNADGTPAAGALVTFAVANGAATLTLERVKTDANGRATTTLQPVAGKIGADIVAASFTPASSTTALSAQTVFSVSATNVSLNAVTAAPASISSYGASVITVDVSGASSSAPVTVNFSSTCVTAGKAELSPASVTVTGTTASTTYQDKKGCAATDRITASISSTSQQKQVDLVVAAPTAQSLEFVSASPDKICLAGSGCEISSKVSFKLKDQYNNPITNRTVNFSLDIPNVATLGSTALPTDASGVVTVSVTAKATPTPVRVRAQVADDPTLSTVSNALAINAGLPTQNAFSFSASTYNPDGWSRDGTESDIRVQLNDRFGNPVPDGTVISFVAEGASVIPAKCATASGVCTTKFVTSNYRPPDGRVTVLAYAQGEEFFADANGDQKYTSAENSKDGLAENFTDLGEVFIDANENGVMDGAQVPDNSGRFIGNEYIAGSPLNKTWDPNTYVRMSRVFVLADASRAPRLQAVGETDSCSPDWDPDKKPNAQLPGNGLQEQPLSTKKLTDISPAPTPSACRVQRFICLRDANMDADKKKTRKYKDGDVDKSSDYWLGGNPIPSGATLAVTTKAKGASVKIDNTPIVSQLDNSPTRHVLTVELDDCTKALEAGGAIDLTIKMPNGQSYPYDLGRIN